MKEELSRHLTTLRRYALVLTRDPVEAEDLVQDALVRAIEGAATWQPGRDLLPWLMSIVHNTHVSRVRRSRLKSAAESRADLPRHDEIPPGQIERVQLNQTIAALMGLSEEHREALVLVALEGLSYKDAADVLGVPLGTLMSRLGRAREALRSAVSRGEQATQETPPGPRLRLLR